MPLTVLTIMFPPHTVQKVLVGKVATQIRSSLKYTDERVKLTNEVNTKKKKRRRNKRRRWRKEEEKKTMIT